jgi:hypothetical protein
VRSRSVYLLCTNSRKSCTPTSQFRIRPVNQFAKVVSESSAIDDPPARCEVERVGYRAAELAR